MRLFPICLLLSAIKGRKKRFDEGDKMKIGRRVFLYLLAAGAAAGLYRGRHKLGVFFRGAEKTAGPRTAEDPFVRGGKSLISVVEGRDLKAMVREAVSLIGGFRRLDLKGKAVLVKPNVVAGRENPTTTNPALVGAVAQLLYEEGASRVYVGDMSALIRGATYKNMERTGILKAATDAGAETVCFEDYGWVRVNIPAGRYLQEVDVSEWIFRVDRIVNLPVIKTHSYAGYSICLKNFVGATHFSQRPYLVDRDHWPDVVAELNLAYRPDLNIVDGTKIMVEGGPWEGKTEETNLVMASGDRIACDVVGLGIIRSFGLWKRLDSGLWQQEQVRRAVELGLGARRKEEMELFTASLEANPQFYAMMEKVNAYL